MELIEIIAGKLHGIKVTESALHYHGSVTIDEDIIKSVGFIPMEFVRIWNKASGSRISTYVLPGKAGSGVVCLNGAAARSCQIGDEVIISSWRNVTPEELNHRTARVVAFRHDRKVNEIAEIFEYDLKAHSQNGWEFFINEIEKR